MSDKVYYDVEPCGFRVLVKLKKMNQEVEEKTESGIVFGIKTQQCLEWEQRGTQLAYVVSIGKSSWKGFDDGHPWCKEGDLVLICKHAGDDMDFVEEDEIYRVIADRDIECILREKDNGK